jgi:hypothetical protein
MTCSERSVDEKATIGLLHGDWVCGFGLWAGGRAAAAVSRIFCGVIDEQTGDAGGTAGAGGGIGRGRAGGFGPVLRDVPQR